MPNVQSVITLTGNEENDKNPEFTLTRNIFLCSKYLWNTKFC